MSRARAPRPAPVTPVLAPPGLLGVLVVEDDPDFQWRLARMLTVHGHRVVGTSTGEGALALIAVWPAEIVLIDESLAGQSGVELGRRILGARAEARLVLMTATGGEELTRAAHAAGFVATILKPFGSETLTALMRTLDPSIG